MSKAIDWVERGCVFDSLIRMGIRHLLTKRLAMEGRGNDEERRARHQAFVDWMRGHPIAEHTDKANEQHYGLPADFFRIMLGPRLKYSCGLWTDPAAGLSKSEEAMMELTCRRADIGKGQDILDLGCGWGSLSIWMAEQYPEARITALSNSDSQREFIEQECMRRHVGNVRVITADMNEFEAEGWYDRVVSVEMFEHLRNYEEPFARIARWLKPGGCFFLHIFSHREFAYPFEVGEEDDWMAQYFFTGGIMPSDDLPLHFQRDLLIEQQWRVNGLHYSRTLETWLDKLDASISDIRMILERVYGMRDRDRWFRRWRLFLMACSELFAYRGGEEWGVSHYLFRPRKTGAA